MKRTSLTRALLLAGALAMAGAVNAAPDDDLSMAANLPGTHTETWFWPDGTSYTLTVVDDATALARDDGSSTLQTTTMGAGPVTPLADSSETASNIVTQTWLLPDGTSKTITWVTPSGSQNFRVAVLPEPLP